MDTQGPDVVVLEGSRGIKSSEASDQPIKQASKLSKYGSE